MLSGLELCMYVCMYVSKLNQISAEWFVLFFINVHFEQKKEKSFSVFIYDVIIRQCKNFVRSHDLAAGGLFSWIIAGLDYQMDKFDTGIPSSAGFFSSAALCFPLSSRCTPNSSSTSATSIFSSQRHQDRLPDDLQEDAPSRPQLHVYRKDKYNCSFLDLLRQLGCRCMFCFTNRKSGSSNRLGCRTFVKKIRQTREPLMYYLLGENGEKCYRNGLLQPL